MKVYLHTLTPLHIGTGELYQKIDYVIENGRFYKINAKDFEDFISLFPKEKESLMAKYIEWIDKHIEALRDGKVVKDNLALKFQSDQFTMKAFAAYIQKVAEYKKMIAQKDSFRLYGKINRQVRGLAGSYAQNQYHIAGSSMKGAVRTALLFHVYNNETLHYHSHLKTELQKCLSEHMGGGKDMTESEKLTSFIAIMDKACNELHARAPKEKIRQKITEQAQELLFSFSKENIFEDILIKILKDSGLSIDWQRENALKKLQSWEVVKAIKALTQRENYRVDAKKFNVALDAVIENPFYCGYLDDIGEIKHDSEYYDISKFIQITDAHISSKGNNREPIQVWETLRFNEKLIKDELSLQKTYKIDVQDSGNPLMVWRSGLVWEFDIEIQLIQILRIYQNLCNTDNRKIWIDFEVKINDFLGIDIVALSNDLASISDREAKNKRMKEEQKRAERALLNTVHSFYDEVLEFEKQWFSKKREGYVESADKYASIFSQTYEMDWENKHIMRLGFAAGFPSHTVLLLMLKDKDTQNMMRKIMKALKIGHTRKKDENEKPIAHYTPNLEDFPKSRLLAVDKVQALYPLGWVQLLTENEYTHPA